MRDAGPGHSGARSLNTRALVTLTLLVTQRLRGAGGP